MCINFLFHLVKIVSERPWHESLLAGSGNRLDGTLYAVLGDKLTFPAAESITLQLGHRPCCGPKLCSRKHMATMTKPAPAQLETVAKTLMNPSGNERINKTYFI